MIILTTALWLGCLVQSLAARPPPQTSSESPDEMINNLEYGKYLQEVFKYLDNDPSFKLILQNATAEEIQSGSVSEKLHMVHPEIRSKLDEAKRVELERLSNFQHQAERLKQHQQHPDASNHHIMPSGHFNEEDLKRLIQKTTQDLAQLDKQRNTEFAEHEMKKRQEYEEGLKKMNEQEKAEAVKKHQEQIKAKKEHTKEVHHPLSEDQLEEVWEEQDHQDKSDYDPETFFAMHDLDGDDYLDHREVMALFNKELDKMYPETDSDPEERHQEMLKMMKQAFLEVDQDKDGRISRQEFMESAKHEDYKKDQGWEGIDSEPAYNEQEYQEYVQQHPPTLAPAPTPPGIAPAPPGVHA